MKPLLKWAGGKRRLADRILERFPPEIDRYVEPFVGGGAVFCRVATRPSKPKSLIADINPDIANLYEVVRRNPNGFMTQLDALIEGYMQLEMRDRKEYFLGCRMDYNQIRLKGNPKDQSLRVAALLVFLNKTCYNGLYRLNAKGGFNTPFGNVSREPKFYNLGNVLEWSGALRFTAIRSQPFDKLDLETFLDGAEPSRIAFYLDPPYRPVSKTSNFNSYFDKFDDDDQRRLAQFCRDLDAQGYRFVLSNSDAGDGFFDELYAGFDIERVEAARSINSKASKRGAVPEILVYNWK